MGVQVPLSAPHCEGIYQFGDKTVLFEFGLDLTAAPAHLAKPDLYCVAVRAGRSHVYHGIPTLPTRFPATSTISSLNMNYGFLFKICVIVAAPFVAPPRNAQSTPEEEWAMRNPGCPPYSSGKRA